MKKNTPLLLILVLLFAQGASYFKISGLERRLEQTTSSLWSLQDSVNTQINSIYMNVDEMLEKQASAIEQLQTTLGAPDAASLTVPVTYTILPKEVSSKTAVSLDFGDRLLPMERNGTSFSLTVEAKIFDTELDPTIVITEGDVTKTEKNDALSLYRIRDEIFPYMHIRFMGSYGGNSQGFHITGTLSADKKPVSTSLDAVTYEEALFVIKVDDTVLSEKPIDIGRLDGHEVDEEISLQDGETCTMIVVITDSLELEHHYTIASYVQGNQAQREPQFDEAAIYTKDGTLLRKPAY
ncbi:MAG TPA: hypothetical protein DF480_03250 [Clostridiales bacterium]|nr:hypothetical protein [Clostridiales bacterium]